MNRPLERQLIGAVVSILNSICPRMGFLTEEKQFETKKLTVKGNFSNHMKIGNMGKFLI